MARKIAKKLGSKNLKGALLRHQAQEKLRKTIEQKEKNKLANKAKPSASVLRNQKIQKDNQAKFIPFEKNDTLLLIGEGDFSFAKSLIEEDFIKPENLIVTSFDTSPQELKLKYPHSFEENYSYLLNENVKIFFKIDATNLIKTFKISKKNPWSKILGPTWKYKPLENIMFNFPHTGKGIKDQDRNIKDHQELVFNFFHNCIDLFTLVNKPYLEAKNNHTQGYDTLSDTNNKLTFKGYGKIIMSLFTGEPYDSWQVKRLAKSINFQVDRSSNFQWENFPGYHHKRTNSEQDTTKPAQERQARMYVFNKRLKFVNSKKKSNKDDSDDDSD